MKAVTVEVTSDSGTVNRLMVHGRMGFVIFKLAEDQKKLDLDSHANGRLVIHWGNGQMSFHKEEMLPSVKEPV